MNVDTGKAGITNSSGHTEARETLLKSIELDKKDAAERQKKMAIENKKRRQLCASYSQKYQRHLRSQYTYKKTADGGREFLSEAKHDALRAKLKAGKEKYCGS
jgi:hypothetical protein